MRLADMPVEDIPLSAEEKAECDRETEQMFARMQLGSGPEPALSSVGETLMAGAQVSLGEQTVELPAPVDNLDPRTTVLESVTEQRQRYDFRFSLTRINVEVGKKVILGPDGQPRMVSASTRELGPARYEVTWGFLTSLTLMVVQYAMPLNRMAKLLSTPDKKFTAGGLGRLLHYVALRLVPVYLELVDQLADAPILSGDDTPSRVVEVNSYFDQPDDERSPPPWASYRTRQQASQELGQRDSLAVLLASELGFEFQRRNGTGAKQSLNTTTASGRSRGDDPRSLIVLYRSHLGGFGNLLEVLLEKRKPKARKLTIQSDLATVNLVPNAELRSQFKLRLVGCMSHARRPFALYEHEDPDRCAYLLHLFQGIAIHEQALDLHGRNRHNVLAVRQTDSRELWEQIKELAQVMSERWSASTKLGAGARYIVRHYDELTAYLSDPRLEPTNNFSERMLRMEKLIEDSSLFRRTLEGRFALDITRSILQTAVVAGAPPDQYLLSVLRADPDEVELSPEAYTPAAWAAAHPHPDLEPLPAAS